MNSTTRPDAYGELIEPTTLKIQRLLPGPIERIWAYLTDSELRRKWLAAGAMEMKVGAPVELVWRNDELNDPPGKRPAGFPGEHRMQSRITELDPLRKLVDRLEQQRRRDVRTGAQRQGRAAHGDPSASARSLDLLKVSAGWHMHLDVLVARASGEEPAPFWEGWSPPAAGIRPPAAGLNAASRSTRNKHPNKQEISYARSTPFQRRSGKPRASKCW